MVNEPKQNLQDQLTDTSKSAIQRYQLLALGNTSWWYLVKYELIVLFFSGLPGALGLILRKWFYPMILGSVGKNVIFGRGLTIRHGLKISIEDNVTIDDLSVLDAKGVGNQGIEIEENTIISRNCVLSCKGASIFIGKNCTLGINSIIHARDESDVRVKDDVLCGAYCYLIGGGPFITKELDVPFKKQGMTSKGGIVINQNVWLGSSVQVMDGITIGKGSIIGSNAVVNKPIDEYLVCGGVPVKTIKSRKNNKI